MTKQNGSPFAKRETDRPDMGGTCPECGYSRKKPPSAPDDVVMNRDLLALELLNTSWLTSDGQRVINLTDCLSILEIALGDK